MEELISSLWDEWVSLPVPDPVSAESELSGIICSLRKSFHRDEAVRLSSRRLWIFRRIRFLWPKTRWGSAVDMGDILKVPKRHRGSVCIQMPLSLFVSCQAKEHDRSFLRWSWVRGVFGASGALYLPKGGYYFLFRVSGEDIEAGLTDHMKKNSIPFSKRTVRNFTELIVRGQPRIVDIMSGMGLSETALKLEERAIVRSIRDQANRLVNCDASNIRKSVDAARWQTELAQFFLKNGHIQDLPSELVELINLRIANPSASLNELGISMKTPVTKSTVTYRWKKLAAIAESYGFVSKYVH